jgi:hypothetical protein
MIATRARRYKIALAGVAIVFSLLFMMGQILLRGQVFTVAAGYLHSSKTLTDSLGQILDIRISLRSTIQINGLSGHAQYKLRIKGEKATGTAYVDMAKQAGAWSVRKANLIMPNGEIRNL